MNIQYYSSLEEIDPGLWNSIVPRDKIICRHEYLMGIEKSHINDCDYRYLLIYEGETLVAHTCFYSMSFDLDIFNTGPAEKMIKWARSVFNSQFMRIKVIECGTPTALGSTITIKQEFDEKEVYALITDKMDEYAREKKTKILIMRDFYANDLPVSDHFRLLGFRRVPMLPNTQVVNNWTSFEDYLNDMRSRYRYRIKKFMKNLEKSGIKVEVIPNFSSLAGELTGLWFQIYDHAKEYKREILTPEFFINMDKYLGDRSMVVTFRKEGALVAFDFVIEDDDTLRPLFIGMDYNHNHKGNLYFNILCHSVKMGLDMGKKAIEMGITTVGPKKEIGAEVIPTYGYMKHRSKLAHFFVTSLFSLFAPPLNRDRKHVFNRRYFQRIYTDFTLHIRYRNSHFQVKTRDISERGLKVLSPEFIPKKKKILLEFDYLNEYNFFSVYGKVVWTAPAEENQFSMGIQFPALPVPVREKLDNLRAFIGN